MSPFQTPLARLRRGLSWASSCFGGRLLASCDEPSGSPSLVVLAICAEITCFLTMPRALNSLISVSIKSKLRAVSSFLQSTFAISKVVLTKSGKVEHITSARAFIHHIFSLAFKLLHP